MVCHTVYVRNRDTHPEQDSLFRYQLFFRNMLIGVLSFYWIIFEWEHFNEVANYPMKMNTKTENSTPLIIDLAKEIKYSYGSVKQNFKSKTMTINWLLSLNICCGYSKEPSHWDGSFEYPQHKFWMRNDKINLRLTVSYLEGWLKRNSIFTNICK